MKLQFLSVLILAAVCFLSCETDFEVEDEWEENVIVYGLLDDSKDEQYIRIQKAYLAGDEDAREVASRKDSLYFDEGEIEAELQKWQSGTQQASYTLIPEQRDDKKSGLFAYPEHIAYRTPDGFSVDPNARYRLKIETNQGNTITGETEIVETAHMLSPHPRRDNLSFVDSTFMIMIEAAPNAYFYDLKFRFIYEEFPEGEEDQADSKAVEWYAYQNRQPDGGQVRESSTFHHFFNMIDPLIPEDDGVERRAKNFDIMIFGGSRELYNYIRVQQPSLGIVENRPEYSNLENGRGIFSSRKTQVRRMEFGESFIDSIVEGSYLPDKNFIH